MTETPLVGTTFFGLDVSQLGAQLMSLRRRISKRLLLLEFSASGLRYAEAAPSLDGIRFSHVSRVPLPEEALDRGVPSDPTMMASLIKALCQEKGIPAHRAAVVLSPDIAYQRTIELPSALTLEDARAYLLAPTNDVPLPFPLAQTDFDLYPLPFKQDSSLQPYLLIAIPQTLIDRVISLLDEAGFELQALELGPFSLLRFLADELIGLCDSDVHLVLELLPDCSQLCVVSSSGPVRFERLSAIRDFPDPDLDDVQRKEALDAGLSAEEITLKDERYLPISELDLRAVLRDVKAVISDLTSKMDSTMVRGLSLSGINSAHPLIKDIFQEALGCDVKVIKPILMSRVSGFSPDDLLVQAGLARLIGLGLSFLPREQLLSCHLPEISPPSTLAPLPSLAVDAIIDSQENSSNSVEDPLDVEVTELPSDALSHVDTALLQDLETSEEGSVVGRGEELVREGEEEWPSMGLVMEEKEEVETSEEGSVVGKGEELVREGEEEWPSMGLVMEEKEEVETSEEGSVVGKGEELVREGEEEWPSMGLVMEEKEEVETSEEGSVVGKGEELVREGEEEWPSMGLVMEEKEEVETSEEGSVVGKGEESVSEEEEEWPSMGLVMEEKEEIETSEEGSVVGKGEELVREGEEEWPSMGLVMEEKEEVETSKEGSVVGKGEEMVREGEEEWPSMGLVMEEKEEVETSEEGSVVGKGEESVREGEEEWPSMGLVMEEKEEVETSEEGSVVGKGEESVREGEEEWPSMGLVMEEKEEVETSEEGSVVGKGEELVSEEEEEWPSMGLVMEEKEEVETSEEGSVVGKGEESVSEEEEEWPSMGLVMEEKEEVETSDEGDVVEEDLRFPTHTEQQKSESMDSDDQFQENGEKIVSVNPEGLSSESSSLGTLRFRED